MSRAIRPAMAQASRDTFPPAAVVSMQTCRSCTQRRAKSFFGEQRQDRAVARGQCLCGRRAGRRFVAPRATASKPRWGKIGAFDEAVDGMCGPWRRARRSARRSLRIGRSAPARSRPPPLAPGTAHGRAHRSTARSIRPSAQASSSLSSGSSVTRGRAASAASTSARAAMRVSGGRSSCGPGAAAKRGR